MDMNDGLSPATIEGMNKALDHAEAVAPAWKLRAALALVQYINAHPDTYFIAPDVRKWAEANGLDAPPTNMAWGGIFNAASKRGVIKSVGTRRWSDETCHTRVVLVWAAP